MTDMRKCRNWQTSKTKDLVLIASVWVQVPSSALEKEKRKPFIMEVSFFLYFENRDVGEENMEFLLKTERLMIQPYSNSYLEQYFKEFTDEIVKYQYPDSFCDINKANEVMSKFVTDMKQGKMLELVILTHAGEFLGSMEAFDITGKTPELGIWLKSSAQGKGYGHEALKCLVDYLNSTDKYEYYLYGVDQRNESSVHLVEKFHFEKCGYEEVTTQSGKTLHLLIYHIIE